MKTGWTHFALLVLLMGTYITACSVQQNTNSTVTVSSTAGVPQITLTFAIGQRITLHGTYFYVQLDFVTPTPGQSSEYYLFTDEHGNQIVLVPKNPIPTAWSGKKVVVVGEIVKLGDPLTVAVTSIEEISSPTH